MPNCPSCGQPASGRFCSHCGAETGAPVSCAQCGNQLPPGGRFCNQCGTAAGTAGATAVPSVAPPAARSRSALPWAVAGVLGAALLAVLLLRGGEEPDTTPAQPPFAAGGAVPVGDPRAVDLASMTPREAADRLFERVMRLSESGDSAQARNFLPMALAAYDRVPELDADARYHLGVLHLFNQDAAAASAQADTILAAQPDHLFGLYVAARADQAQGDGGAARTSYQRFLDRFEAERASGKPEYEAHAPALEIMRQDAARAVDSP